MEITVPVNISLHFHIGSTGLSPTTGGKQRVLHSVERRVGIPESDDHWKQGGPTDIIYHFLNDFSLQEMPPSIMYLMLYGVDAHRRNG